MIKGNKKRVLSRVTAFMLSLVLVFFGCAEQVSASEIYRVPCDNIEKLTLIPGGMPFGVQILSEGVAVVGVGTVKCDGKSVSPAKDAGIAEGDVILQINGRKVAGAADFADSVNLCGDGKAELLVRRGDSEITITVTPVACDEDGRYRAGLLIREGTSGIGTVTYIHPETGSFAGLGHGICDIDTGKIVPVTRGSVVNVDISGVIKGKPGSPGELQGYFSSGKVGTLFDNRDCGVYGVFCNVPENTVTGAIPVASADEVYEGDAEILCTTGNDGVRSYKVRLSNIDHSGRSVKNFVVTVTDPALLVRTGGIVQGM